uniref:Uncharacterized protein n=1 Tax=Chryseobacterium sp. B5 TaxID=2050562 RepID=A0A2G7SWL9_9FLAO
MFCVRTRTGVGAGRRAQCGGKLAPHATLAAQGPLPPQGGPLFCLGAARRQKKAPTLGAVRRRKPRSPLAVRRSIIAAAPKKTRARGYAPDALAGGAGFCLSFRMRTARAGPPCRIPRPVPAPPRA